MISEINPVFLRGSFLHFKWQRSLFILKVVFFICNYILIYSSIFKNLFRRDIGCLIRIDQLFHYLKNNKKQLTNKTKRDLIGAIFLEYSRVPNKSFHSLICSKNFPLLPSPTSLLLRSLASYVFYFVSVTREPSVGKNTW